MMKNSKKLELTLCGMLPYDLKGKRKDGAKGQYFLNSLKRSEYSENEPIWKPDFFGDHTMLPMLPILHSMDKLTEPILEGGLIPIVELAKVAGFTDNNFTVNFVEKLSIHSIVAKDFKSGFYFNSKYINFSLNLWGNGSLYIAEINQLKLFEKLKQWHFNIYNLPKEMYVEKTEL